LSTKSIAAAHGCSHTTGGYDGGQAEYVRVPFADVGPNLIPDRLDEDDAVHLTDALATGYFGAQRGDIAEGDVVVVFGAGPVGRYATKSAWMMGAGDRPPGRAQRKPPPAPGRPGASRARPAGRGRAVAAGRGSHLRGRAPAPVGEKPLNPAPLRLRSAKCG
jgi:hypothetical protein